MIGNRAERAELERELLEGHRLEPSNLVHVASLEGPGAEAVVEPILDMLGEEAVAAARRYPGLRPAIGRRIVRRRPPGRRRSGRSRSPAPTCR